MILNISNGNTNVIERGVYYYGLFDYPNITTSDLEAIIAFVKYEKLYGRKTEIISDNESILNYVKNAVLNPEAINNNSSAAGDFVYHATGINATKKILSTGKLLCAERVYGKSAEQLSFEKRDSLWNDPPDCFKYIMFCWGDNPTGDYVVLSENFPSEDDLLAGNFNVGIRFYFKYKNIIKHSGHIFDGYHAIKVKDEIILSDYLYACIVPKQFKDDLEYLILPKIASKVHYISQYGVGLQEWNDKVFKFVSDL